MNPRAKYPILFFLILMLSLGACNNDQEQASDSLMGEWNVVESTSIYAEFTPTGFNATETVEESGDLGFFRFTDDLFEYQITRNDTLFEGNGSWDLEADRIRSGFFREPVFYLELPGHFDFQIFLGDGTRNAERNATVANFVERPESGTSVLIDLKLEKK